MKISPARTAAFDILIKIETDKAFSSVMLPVFEENLSPADRGLCHELVLGALRKQIYLDKIIDAFAGGKKLDSAVRIAIRLGLYQLKFLDRIPDHSAINESVNLVQRAKKTSAKGLVNAVLRRVTREDIALEFADEIERISVERSHPRWLVERWIGLFGVDETERLAAANNEVPKLAFRFTAKSSRKDAEHAKRSEFVEGCFIGESFDPELRKLAESGDIYFQDEASQMVASIVQLRSGENFLDVCAAPGSKTTMIAAEFLNNENLIVAGDNNTSRLDFLQQNCAAQGVGFVNIVQYDAENTLPFAAESFDAVLVDAPCSGTGTIRHNPEIRYFLDEADIAELSDKQLRILENASKLVKTGGRLVYSTCSLEREENEAVCEKFMSGNKAFVKVVHDVLSRFVTDDGFARTFPHRDNMDGFFIAVFERK
jgi:16S rRNA (cytosine967-C5)-methyltransferase